LHLVEIYSSFAKFRQHSPTGVGYNRCRDILAGGELVASKPTANRREPELSRWKRLGSWLASRLAWAWHPLFYAGIAAGFLMGRTHPISPVAPFGIAFYMAVCAAGYRGLTALPVGLAALAGAVTVQPLPVFASFAAALLLVHVLAAVARALPQHRALVAALLASVVAAGQGLMQDPAADWVQLAFWAGLAGVLALIFTTAVNDLTNGRDQLSIPADVSVPAIILLAAVLTGLQDLTLWSRISLHGAAAGLAVLLCAHAGGLGWGAAAGAVIGMSSFFSVLANPPASGAWWSPALSESHAMAYVVAGFLAGAFRELRKVGVGLSYVLGYLSYIMATQDRGAVLESMALSAVAATLLFWLIPSRWVTRLAQSARPAEQARTASNEDKPAAPVESSLVTGAADRLRTLAQVLKEIQRTYAQVAAVGTPVREETEKRFHHAAEQVCRSCSMVTHCWKTEAEGTRLLFGELWEQIEREGPLPMAPAPERLAERCIHPEQIVVTLNHLYDLERSGRTLHRRLEEGRAIAGEYVQNVARMLDRMAEEVATGGRSRSSIAPLYRVSTAVARMPKRGCHISGDSVATGPLSEGRFLVALSDGMGVGREAAVQSGESVRLLQQLLDAGFNSEVAVRTLNSVLLLRGPSDTFATVDLALLDLTTGRAEFVKVGAAPSFLKRGNDVTVVRMPSVPAGVVADVEVEPEHRSLREGDIIVMVSDGVLDVARDEADKERWVLEHLAREQTEDPEELAERLLARALDLTSAPEDDLTVVVARVDRAEGHGGAERPRPRPTGEWAPAQPAPRVKPNKR